MPLVAKDVDEVVFHLTNFNAVRIFDGDGFPQDVHLLGLSQSFSVAVPDLEPILDDWHCRLDDHMVQASNFMMVGIFDL